MLLKRPRSLHNNNTITAIEVIFSQYVPVELTSVCPPGDSPPVSRLGILFSMSTTTIKVDRAVRDRLSSIAQARGLTMGALLAQEAHRLETEQRWAEIDDAYERIQQSDPASWNEYLDELAEVTVGDPDTVAETEWPEYNQ